MNDSRRKLLNNALGRVPPQIKAAPAAVLPVRWRAAITPYILAAQPVLLFTNCPKKNPVLLCCLPKNPALKTTQQ